MKSKNQFGFTLIELLIIIAIIGFLATAIIYGLNIARKKAKFATAQSQLLQIAKAAELHYSMTGSYPNESAPGTDPGFVNMNLMSEWPKPPCINWQYDWDNWDHLEDYDPTQQIVRVSLRQPDAEAKFYMCIHSEKKCGGSPIQHDTNAVLIQALSNGNLGC